jgi:CheY-like chemotaxis protein
MLISNPRVILVDDNKDAVDLISQSLAFFKVENKVAYDGHAAVVLLEEWPAHLVFVDIQMPGMSGYQTAAAMRALPGYADLPIVAMTGWDGIGNPQLNAMARFADRLHKPVALQQILEVINRLASSSS